MKEPSAFASCLIVTPAVLVALLGCGGATPAVRHPAEAAAGSLRLFEQSEAQPAMLISELRGRAGGVAQKGEAWFVIGNAGGDEITVRLASKTCTCVGVFVDGEKVDVGAKLAMPVGARKKVKFSGRLDPVASTQRFGGDFIASDESSLILRGSRVIYNDVEPTPSLMSCPMRRDGPAVVDGSVELAHVFRSDEPRLIEPAVAALPPGIEFASVSPQYEPKRLAPGLWLASWKVALRVRPAEVALAPTTLTVAFHADGSRLAEARIPVTAPQAFGLAAPGSVAFGAVEVGARRGRRVVIHSLDGKAFEIKNISTETPQFDAKVSDAGRGARYWIDLGFTPSATGERRAKVSVETTHPDSPRVAFDVVGRGRQHE